MPIKGLAVGPFTLSWEYGRWKFVRGRGGLLSGYAACDIGRFRRVRQRLLWFIAGGPLASLGSGVSAAALALWWLGKDSRLAVPVMGYAVTSVCLFCLGTLMFGRRGKVTDFRRLYDLFFVRREIKRMYCMVALEHAVRSGVQSKNLNERWLKGALELSDGTVFELMANLWAYSQQSSLKRIDAAATHLERCLELSNIVRPFTRLVLISTAATFVAWYWDDAQKAEQWCVHLKTRERLPFLSKLSLEISVCCANNELGRAAELWSKGLRFIEQIPDQTARIVQEVPWREWGQEIDERRLSAEA
jgi:hypothetical protein